MAQDHLFNRMRMNEDYIRLRSVLDMFFGITESSFCKIIDFFNEEKERLNKIIDNTKINIDCIDD